MHRAKAAAVIIGIFLATLGGAALAAGANGPGMRTAQSAQTVSAAVYAPTGVGQTVSAAVYAAQQAGLAGPALANQVHVALQTAFGPGFPGDTGLTVAESVYASRTAH